MLESNNEQAILKENIIPKLRVYLLYETENSEIFLILNEKTPLVQRIQAKEYPFEFNPNLKVYSFTLPDMNFIADSNKVYFELVNNYMMASASFCSPKYNFAKNDPFSYYYMIGVNFQKNVDNIIYREPKGRSLGNESTELFYYFYIIVTQYISKYREIITSGSNPNMIGELIDLTYKKIQDLIESYKSIQSGKPVKNVFDFLRFIDDFIREYSTKEEYPEIYLMIVSLLGGVFQYEQFLSQEIPLTKHGELLKLVSNANEGMLLRLVNSMTYPLMRKFLTNGLIFLISLAIKEGLAIWVRIGSNEALVKYLFTEEEENISKRNLLFEKVNELIRRSGKGIKTKEEFLEVRTYLMNCYHQFSSNKENSEIILNTTMKNISVLSSNKEQLIFTLIEYAHSNLLSLEMLKDFKDEIRRKKWENESIDNVSLIIQQLSELITTYQNKLLELQQISSSEEQMEDKTNSSRSAYALHLFTGELQSLLYELSPKLKDLFILMKVLKNKIDRGLLKKAMCSLVEVTLDEYAFITGELPNIPMEIKHEIIDNNFHENIINCIKKIPLPFANEKVKEDIVTLLLNNELFIAGSLGCVKEFIRSKPNMQDLEFIVRNLILPQKKYGLDMIKDIFMMIRTYLMGLYTEINQLIRKFSDVIRLIEDPNDNEMKMSICEQFWAGIYQRYSPEIFLGLCQVFNGEEEDPQYNALELSYIQFMKNIIESLSTTGQNMEKVNQFFNSVSVVNPNTKERLIFSNSSSTDKIIISLLDIILKASDPKKLSKAFLIENPSQENFWFKLITAKGKCTSFLQHPYVLSVNNCILDTFDGIRNGTLFIHDFISLSKQTPVQKKALAAYIEAVSAKSKLTKDIIGVVIETQMELLNTNLYIISEVENFLNVYGNKIESKTCDEISSFIRNIKHNYKSTEFKDFKLKDNIIAIKDIILDINKWTETVVFKNMFQDKLNAVPTQVKKEEKNISKASSSSSSKKGMMEEIPEDEQIQISLDQQGNELTLSRRSMDSFLILAMETINSIKKSIAEIASMIEYTNLPLKRVLDLFKNLEDPEKECQLLEDLTKHSVKNLNILLKHLSRIAVYIKFSTVLIKLDDCLKFRMSNAKLCKDFIDLMSNLDADFKIVLTLINSIEEIRGKYFSKYDIENILFLISENKELIDFIVATPEEDIRNMVDAVDEHGDSFIRVQTIRDLLIIGSFIRMLKMKSYTSDRTKNPTEEDFITSIISAIDSNQHFTAVDALIDSCSKQYTGIKHLHGELSNREEASKIKAREICIASLFSFKFNSTRKEYEVMILFGSSGKKISFRDLRDLRDRVLLLLYNQQEKIDEKLFSDLPVDNNINGSSDVALREMLMSFIKLVELSEKILFILSDLFMNGYPNRISREIELINGNYESFQDFHDCVTELNSIWSDDLKDAYTKYYPLTYYHGNQFWELEKIFSGKSMNLNDFKNSTGYFLLKYASKEIQVDNILKLKYPAGNSLDPRQRLLTLGEVLSQTIDVKNLHSKPVKQDKNSMINLKITPGQILFTNPSMMKIYHYLLSIHFTIENAIPCDNQLLYCTKNTTFHELISFLYRFAFCPIFRLFSIIRVENLPFELQNFLVDQVNKLMKGGCQNSLLNVICCDKNSYIYHQFDENNLYVNRIRDFEILDEAVIVKIMKRLNMNVYVFRSDDTGAGKTFFIQKLSGYNPVTKKTDGRVAGEYVNFPIFDAINVDKISERLFQLNKRQNNKSIHVTISGVIDNFEMLDLILFKYTIIGCLKHETYVSYRNLDDPFFIEISNTYNDILYNAISILPLIPNSEVLSAIENLKTLDPLAHSTSTFSPLQVVANYLHHYDKGTINANDIHPSKTWKNFTKDEILVLINKYFIKDNRDITFRQVWTFVNVLSTQLILFGNNFYFTVENIRFIQDASLNDIRSKVIESLLAMTDEFTTRSIKSARASQKMTNSLLRAESNVIRDNLNEEENRIDEINSLSSIMSWSKSNHLLIIFHQDGMCMTPVYRVVNDVPPSVKKLMESQKSKLDDYQKMSHVDLLMKLLNIVGKNYSEYYYRTVSYVLTADNFLKMLLIITRARANVPIVIMGETGCGKTSLVRFLARYVMFEAFEVINFHAGITEEYLTDKMTEIIYKACTDYKGTRVWVFLDEINTCDCLGLITEIICQKTLKGEPLPDNLIFISACNPYKIRKDTSDVGLIKQRVATKLVYRVHPLPDSLIDYVWDYGSLSEFEEKLYISNILSNISGEFAQIACEIVCRSQSFIRMCGEKFSVSLRDVARFKILHEWFFKMITEKNKEQIPSKSQIKTVVPSYYSYANFGNFHQSNIKFTGKSQTAKKSLLLALMMCYYNRISKNSDRIEYKKMITKLINVNEKDLEDMITEEQKDIVTRMELPPAIAINRALLENVFTLMVCAINKIPLFICGKPGCSKSLSVQLLVSNLRGQDSADAFFKKLPRILAVPYQGSESSTSEGIQRIFEKAENIIKNDTSGNQILPLIIFDEIGLAEISKNNPLKILHSLLEPENPTVSFVGISNWRLDASKMNRAIYLARPDPDLDDLENTALSIFEYYIKDPRYDEKLIMKILAKTYYEFKKDQTFVGLPDFHGTRDFYSLIKQVTHGFSTHYSNYNENKFLIIKDSLCRNFGGVNNSIPAILQTFAKYMGLGSEFLDLSNKSMMELVKDNLRDPDSRFLLLFTNGSSASYILDNYLKNDLKERIFLIGSEFENDKDKEEHSFKLLSDIILYMENGSSIIMKNLNQIYGSLYDLFNQNFMIVGHKKNCRIALGGTNNPMCFVHQNFHCVVLADIKEINRLDPPFLNRFEKQILTFDSVMSLRHKNLVVDLNRWIKQLSNIVGGEKKEVTSVENLIITYNEDEFAQSIILLHYADEKSNEDILEEAKRSVLSLANINLPIYSVLSEMYQTSRDEIAKVHKIYFEEQCHDSLAQYLYKNHNRSKLIVYTYSNILDEFNFYYENEQIISPYSFTLLNVAELKSEKDFDHRFKLYLQSNIEWMFIKFDCAREINHIPMIKFKIDKMLNEYKRISGFPTEKNIAIIVYLGKKQNMANKGGQNQMSLDSHFLSGWGQIAIDNINGGQISNIESMLKLSTFEIIQQHFDQKTIAEMIFNIYLKFNYIPYNAMDSPLVKRHMTEVFHNLENPNDSEMFHLIIQKSLKFLEQKSSHGELPDWKLKVCVDQKILSRTLNTFQAIRYVVAELMEEPLLKIIHLIETECAFESFYSDVRGSVALEMKRKIWDEMISSKNINELYPYNVVQSLVINPVFLLKFPFSKNDIFELSHALSELIDNIYILDNSAYFNQEIDDEMKGLFKSTFDKLEDTLKSSCLLFKMRNKFAVDRTLEKDYIDDIIMYFLTVELKQEIRWMRCLQIIIEKFLPLEVQNVSFIFLFLFKNKTLIDNLFKLIIALNMHIKLCDLSFIENFLSSVVNELNAEDQVNFVDNQFRRASEVKLAMKLFDSIVKVLLSQLNFIETIDECHYSFMLNTFIGCLTSFTLEIKEHMESLNILKIISEFLKLYSIIDRSGKAGKNIKGLFDEDFRRVNLQDYSFIKRIVQLIDNSATGIMSSNAEMLSDAGTGSNEIREIIANSKMTIFENTLISSKLDYQIQQFIINNIMHDYLLIKYSSILFYRLFSDIQMDDTMIEVENSQMRVIIDRIISGDRKFSQSHIIYPFLTDFFRKFLSKPESSEEGLSNYLIENYRMFIRYVELSNVKDVSKPCVHILGLAGLKHYLEIFAEYLTMITKNQIANKNSDLIRTINLILENNSTDVHVNNDALLETLKNYVLKSIMKFTPCAAQGLSNINYTDLHIKWINNKVFENNDNCLGLEPNFEEVDDEANEYNIFFISLLNDDSEDNIKKFKELLKKASTTSSLKFIIIQFFINKIYLSFTNKNFARSKTYTHLIQVFEHVAPDIQAQLGEKIHNFIYNLVYNFPRTALRDLFVLSPGNNPKVGVIAFIMQGYNLILSYQNERKIAIGNLFRAGRNTLEAWSQLFIPGNCEDYHDENLYLIIKDVEDNWAAYGTSIGLYECTCGYLYTIGNCTRPYVELPCPSCKRTIGGHNHELASSSRLLVNADTRSEAGKQQEIITHLRSKLRNRGGYIVKQSEELAGECKVRHLSQVGFRWLNFFHHSMLLMMIEHNSVTDKEIKALLTVAGDNIRINPVNFLTKHINADIQKFSELLSSRDYYITLIQILGGYLTCSVAQGTNTFSTPKERWAFEKQFDKDYLEPIVSNIARNIQQYKHKYSLEKKINYLTILDENFTEKEATKLPNQDLMRIFRSTRLGSWEDLRNEHLKSKNVENQRMFLKLLIDKLDEISLLSNLYPIVQITNYLLSTLSLRLTRQESKEKKIRDFLQVESNAAHRKLWENFEGAWGKISYNAVQYGCKQLRVLEKFDLDLPIAFLLVDDRELGYGMYMAAAFQYLCQIQNEVLESLVFLIKSDSQFQAWANMDAHRYSVQKISPNEIIMYQTERDYIAKITNAYAKFYDIYNEKFGPAGSLITYNFDKIENELASKLLTNKKMINYEELNKIQYKFELLSVQNKNSNLINEIRAKVPQKSFTSDELSAVKKPLEKLEQANQAHLHQIFSSLEIVFCHMKYSSIEEDSSLAQFISNLNNNDSISVFLKETPPLCSIKLSNIVSLYELTEEMLFKYIIEYVSPEYRSPLEENMKKGITEFLQKAVTEPGKYPSSLNLINVVRRFIIRCLVANLEPSFPIKEYLMRTDFWDMDVEEARTDNFYFEFPDEILIKNTVTLLEYLDQFIKNKQEEEQRQKAMTSKIEIADDKDKINQIKKNTIKKQNSKFL